MPTILYGCGILYSRQDGRKFRKHKVYKKKAQRLGMAKDLF